MKTLSNYILESTNSQKNFFAENFIKTFDNAKLTKDEVITMISKLDMDVIHSISDYLKNTDGQNYLSYAPNDDEFISDKNKDNIIAQISEYIFKYKCIK